MKNLKEKFQKYCLDQGLKNMDRWDMLANVVTTWNNLPSTDSSHLDLKAIGNLLIKEVNEVTKLPIPTSVEIEDSAGHAKTNGGWYTRQGSMTFKPEIIITFKKAYVECALKQVKHEKKTDRFRKLIRTASHEMIHVFQRSNKQIMENTNSDQREAEAYGAELTKYAELPSLRGDAFKTTKQKYLTRYKQIYSPTQIEQNSNKEVGLLVDHGVGL